MKNWRDWLIRDSEETMYRVRALTLPSEKLCEKNGRSEFLC